MKVKEDRDVVFPDIWNEYYPKLTVYLQTTYTGLDTEDMVQEILEKVYRNFHTYNPRFSFNTWIYSIARNCAVDSFRKRNSRLKTLLAVKEREILVFSVKNKSPEKISIDKDIKEGIASFIKSLPEKEREIMYLKFYEELTYKEISRILKMPAGTVKYHVHSIKIKVGNFYTNQFGEKYE